MYGDQADMLKRTGIILLVLAGIAAGAKLYGRSLHGDSDHMCYYRSAAILKAGGNPYWETKPPKAYVYPPLWAFLLIPVTSLPPPVYSIAWCALLGGCWYGSWRLVRRLLRPGDGQLHWAVAVFPNVLLFRYIHTGWGMGQLTLLLSLVALLALWMERERRQMLAAALIAFVAAVKLFPAFLCLVFFRPLRLRHVAACVAFAVAFSLLPACGLGLAHFSDLVKNGFLVGASRSVEAQQLQSDRFSPVVTSWRLAGLQPGMALKVVQVVFLLVCTAVLLGIRREQKLDNLWLGLLLTTMVMVTPMIQENYLTFLLLPLAASLDLALSLPEGDRVRRVLLAGVGVAGFCFNIYSPWVVGRALSDRMMGWGLLDTGLMVFWGTVVWSLWQLTPGPTRTPVMAS
jgi:hypothetical protein